MHDIIYRPIGFVHSPFYDIREMPVQPAGARGVGGTIVILPELEAGLVDLDGFSRITVLYHFHRTSGYSLEVTPFLDTVPHGVFSTRAPRRPNSIGISILRLTGIDGPTLRVEDVDILDGTPVLDIKPYVPLFDAYTNEDTGWLEKAADGAHTARADNRFR
jgi:tRNA (adenine37-N6)-methyltransferase